MLLNKESSHPLYKQIRDNIEADIRSKKLNAGDKIETELELSEKYKVSRITIRKAVEDLVEEGFLIKKQGKGTFVKDKKLQRKIEHLISFSESCRMNNMIPSSIVLNKEISEPTDKNIDFFGLGKDDTVINIQRLCLADGKPIIYEKTTYQNNEKYNFLTKEDLSGSLFKLLKNKYCIEPTESSGSTIEMVYATGDIAQWLNVPLGNPLFLVKSRIVDKNKEPVYFAELYIIADKYKFTLS